MSRDIDDTETGRIGEHGASASGTTRRETLRRVGASASGSAISLGGVASTTERVSAGHNGTEWDELTGSMGRFPCNDPEGPIGSQPTVADEFVYVGDRGGYIHALDVANARHRWKYRAGNAIWSSPFVSDDTIYFGSNDTYVYAIERDA
jgi:outer membrane protein assembly factor BamB